MAEVTKTKCMCVCVCSLDLYVVINDRLSVQVGWFPKSYVKPYSSSEKSPADVTGFVIHATLCVY